MKKIISILVILAILTITLCGCGTSKASLVKTSNPSNSTSASEEIDMSIFKEVKASSENLKTYRKEVSSRTEGVDGDEYFISEKDWNAIQLCWDSEEVIQQNNCFFTAYNTMYQETSEYYFPVVYKDGKSLIMWYTTETGEVLLKKLYGYWNSSNYAGQAHTDKEGVVVDNHQGAELLYNQKTGKVDYWSFGKKYETVDVPKGAEYCGHSYFEGHIFRVGSDVYALRTGFYEEGKQVECIAHNVKYVIDASYSHGSDSWSQPLFQMTDGSIKCYIHWEGYEDTPDDSSHLCDLQYEGSYDK